MKLRHILPIYSPHFSYLCGAPRKNGQGYKFSKATCHACKVQVDHCLELGLLEPYGYHFRWTEGVTKGGRVYQNQCTISTIGASYQDGYWDWNRRKPNITYTRPDGSLVREFFHSVIR